MKHQIVMKYEPDPHSLSEIAFQTDDEAKAEEAFLRARVLVQDELLDSADNEDGTVAFSFKNNEGPRTMKATLTGTDADVVVTVTWEVK